MPAPSPLRQSFPYWQVRRGALEAPARGAKIIAFPGARAREARVVTYKRVLTLPERRMADQDESAEARAATIAGGVVAVLICLMAMIA